MTHSIAPMDFFDKFGEFKYRAGTPLTVHAQVHTHDDGRTDRVVVVNECEVSIADVPALVNAILAARDAVAGDTEHGNGPKVVDIITLAESLSYGDVHTVIDRLRDVAREMVAAPEVRRDVAQVDADVAAREEGI